MTQPSIHFIGGGQMAEAIIKALIAKNAYTAADISVADVDPARLQHLGERFGIQVNVGPQPLQQAELIVLAVRPQDDLQGVGEWIRQHARRDAIVVSLIAGVKIALLEEATGFELPLVRIIPNTLTDTGYGYSGVALGTRARKQQLHDHAGLNRFLTGFGKVEHVDEALLDIFTGFGVAGPNYVYYFIESFADAGVLAGLPRAQAWRLALENVKGAVAMLEKSGLHPRQLLDINNSAGGVGINGLYELNNSDFAAGLQRSVLTAVRRTRELGERK